MTNKNIDVSQDRLKTILIYDPLLGVFSWREPCGGNKIGSLAGTKTEDGYINIGVDKIYYRAHRLAWLYMEGYFPEHDIDHINGIRHDNRWCNLRHVSRSCNARNSVVRHTNKSGVKGVSWHKGKEKWVSTIRYNGKQVWLGAFNKFIEAVKARYDAEVKYNYYGCQQKSSAYNFLKFHEGL